MKKFYLSILMLTAALVVSAQSDRVILLEHFTQASCGPCATYNPDMQEMIELPENNKRIISIKYQTEFPGYDPMHDHNPADVNYRQNYYGVTGVPGSVLDGNQFNGHPANWGQSFIDSRADETSPFDLELTHSLNSAEDTVFIHMVVKASQASSGTKVAYATVVEREISFSTPPGSNGERDFYNVMKKTLPDTNGYALPASFADGDSVVMDFSWAIENMYDLSQLSVVGFVQNTSNKEIDQAGYSRPLTNIAYDLSIDESMIPQVVCGNSFTPSFRVSNNGGEAITSATIEYTINGESSSYDWTGDIRYLDYDFIELPAITFTEQASNTYEFNITNLNGGQTDNNTADNSASGTIEDEKLTHANVVMQVKTDFAGDEITWTLGTTSGITYFSGGPYTRSQLNTYDYAFSLPGADCYELNVYDAAGNGIFAGGYVKLEDANGVEIVNTGVFTDNLNMPFQVDANTLGMDEEFANSLEVYPNPATNLVNVSLELQNQSNVQIDVYNVIGKLVSHEVYGNNSPGVIKEQINVEDWTPGIYEIRVTMDQRTTSKKIVIR